ncbi:MAG: helix-turn-helix domain-containing protein [Coprococcus sp.]
MTNKKKIKENHLSIAIRTLRYNSKMKQSDIATALGISISSYSHYECGTRIPDIKILLQLSKLYNISMNHLVFLACMDLADETIISSDDVYDIFSCGFTLPEDELELLNNYRSSSDVYKKNVLLFCQAAHECSR